MNHCCQDMTVHLADGKVAISFLPKFREYCIRLKRAPAIATIQYCPWCGKRLPDSLRGVWFKKIEAMGFELGDPRIPSTYMSEEWYSSQD